MGDLKIVLTKAIKSQFQQDGKNLEIFSEHFKSDFLNEARDLIFDAR